MQKMKRVIHRMKFYGIREKKMVTIKRKSHKMECE